MADRVLLIGAGWEQARLAQLMAAASNCEVIGLTMPGNEPPAQLAKSIELPPQRVADVLAVAEEQDITAVVSDQDDYAHFAAAMVATQRRLRGPSIQAAQLNVNKFLSRRCAQQNGLRVPAFRLCHGPQDAVDAFLEVGPLAVVKPVDSRGSIGVSIVASPEEAGAASIDAIAQSPMRAALVETFIEGENIILEGYCTERGHLTLALGRKDILDGRPHIHRNIRWIAASDAPQEFATTNDGVVHAMGFSFGMTSAEYVVDAHGELWLIEIANRGGGVQISSHVVPLVSGIDTTAMLVADALGADCTSAGVEESSPAAAFLGYFTFEPGYLEDVAGIDELPSLDGVVCARYWGPRSGHVDWPRNAVEKQGFFVTSGADIAEAEQRAQNVYARVRPRYAN